MAGQQQYHSRARADAGDAPARTEQQAAADQPAIRTTLGRQLHRLPQPGLRQSPGKAEGRQRNGDGTGHHQGQGRVPGAGQIEEGKHFGRVGHAREQQTQTEYQAGEKSTELVHRPPPIRCRIT
ncbi:hypothetical protein D3C80_1716170 [compost metagenome]